MWKKNRLGGVLRGGVVLRHKNFPIPVFQVHEPSNLINKCFFFNIQVRLNYYEFKQLVISIHSFMQVSGNYTANQSVDMINHRKEPVIAVPIDQCVTQLSPDELLLQ